ncbi:hypothetical protein [Mycolicibacterium mengxianglii]|uniref:hypothetical protein n=1 Tax=Mycolicibacterium mengxianglii TaxID=2736649 RepID=UPI0018D10C89|nr:hypothetical protein [Mycolicibacterium mengxianglii]
MPNTDDVLRSVVKQWLTELPDAERTALINEVTASPATQPNPENPVEQKPKGTLAAGRDQYRKQHGGFEIEGTEQIHREFTTGTGGWS